MEFSELLINWYKTHKRDLPWRNTANPYFIWLSEIILQQTQVKQGLPYYLKFIETFPTIKDLAEADEQEVLKIWQGLGYYSRARNLHFAAKQIWFDRKGKFPENYNEWLNIKGVGQYTAAAISSIAYNEPVAVLDGNVFRVLARVFDIDLDISSSKGKNYFFDLANELIDKQNPAEYNQAIMDFGALQCVPSTPDCVNCPLSEKCLALANNVVDVRPVKLKKVKIKKRYFHYFIIKDINDNLMVQQRTGNDIWKNMYQLPLIETNSEQLPKNIVENKLLRLKLVKILPKHVLSHQHILGYVWECDFNRDFVSQFENTEFVSEQAFKKLPIPRLVTKIFE